MQLDYFNGKKFYAPLTSRWTLKYVTKNLRHFEPFSVLTIWKTKCERNFNQKDNSFLGLNKCVTCLSISYTNCTGVRNIENLNILSLNGFICFIAGFISLDSSSPHCTGQMKLNLNTSTRVKVSVKINC